MSGRGDIYRFEPPRFFRGLASLSREISTLFMAREAPALFGLRQCIPALVPGDAVVARDLYRGRLRLASRLFEGEPHGLLSPSADARVTDEMLSLSWLPHLAAADMALYRGFSRSLYKLCARPRSLSTLILCRRLMILSRHADFMLAGAPSSFAREFFDTMSRETRTLKAARMRTAEEELHQALALLAVSMAFRGAEDLRSWALDRAAATIPKVILLDGGHASRNPQALLGLLLDLIPLQEALRTSRVSAPQFLDAAIGRACSMLRMMCHPDGGLALFQGVDNSSVASVLAVLSSDPHQQAPTRHAMQSGYARLDRGKSAIIMDVGGNGDYRGALSFEFSHGCNRIVTNCGTPEFATPAWRAAARSAAAHSGLQLHEPERPRFSSFRGRSRRCPTDDILRVDVTETEQGTAIAAAVNSSGLVHHREILLDKSGYGLEGQDRFVASPMGKPPNGEARFTLRFHLDPAVKAFSGRSGSAIMLMLPNRGVWQFSAGRGKAMLEDSVALAGSGGLRNNQQIVIRDTVERLPQIDWTFRRVEKPSRHDGSGEDSPGLPF